MAEPKILGDDEKITQLNPPKHFSLGTPEKTIVEAMKNAKEGEKFTMSFAITPCDRTDPASQEQRNGLREKREQMRRKSKETL